MRGLTVATVLRSGGDYSPAWFYALKRGLMRHMPGEYRSPLHDLEDGTWTLVCLTDMEVGPHGVPLVHGWPGWWSKIELFRLQGRILYMDLDTLPVGDLGDLAAYDGPFAMLSDFYRPKVAESGVMAWEPSEATESIYARFCERPTEIMARFRGDGRWIRHVMPEAERLQDCYPGQLVSLKVHAKDGPPEGARLICCHGRPRPDDPKAGWLNRRWADLARKSDWKRRTG